MAVVNVNPRGGATLTVVTERTKRRRNTRNINLINTAESGDTHTQHSHTDTQHCSYHRDTKGEVGSNSRRDRLPGHVF